MKQQALTVKKANDLITASYSLTLAEQRMVLLAIACGQSQLDGLHKVTAGQYAETYKVTRQAAYEALQAAAAQLFERRYSTREQLEGGKVRHAMKRWVSEVAYIEGGAHVEMRFAPAVLKYLDDLKSKFTAYRLEQVADLTSVHAIRLYELLMQWRSLGQTPKYELSFFRDLLGIEPDEYPRMDNFKNRVLDVAINQINEHTDIKATYEQHKHGRKIVGFSFSFVLNQPNRDPNTVDMLTGQTDAEISGKPKRQTISRSKAESMAKVGETWEELYRRLSSDYVIKG